MKQYKAIVIGTGQGGMPLATALAQAGWRTAVIESLYVGGCCINYGCTPTKTMWNSARAAYLARRAAEHGVRTGDVEVDMAAVRQRKAGVVADFRTSDERRLQRTENLDLVFAEASFADQHTIHLKLRDGGSEEIEGENIFINTGGLPLVPAIEGLDQVGALDSTAIQELDALPEHLLVLGGSYIGLEFAQMFRRFGSEVTIVQDRPFLIAQEDEDVSEEMAKILRDDGIHVLVNSTATKFTRNGRIRMTLSTEHGEREVEGSHLLVAIGRVPNTAPLNLDAAGIEHDDRGTVRVNARLETNVPGVYAIGDVKGGPQFTHISYDDFRVLRDNLLHGGNHTIDGRPVPYTMFTDPQLGRIGVNERAARAGGKPIKVGKMPMAYVARAIEMAETRGFMKVVVDAESERILGFTALGVEGGELMAMVEIAMLGNLPYPVLREAIFAHPTLAESLNNLFGDLK